MEEKKPMEYTIPETSLVVKGIVFALGQLSAKFQIWCRQFGISDGESLAMWVVGTRELLYFTPGRCEPLAKAGREKLPKDVKEIDLTEI